MSEPMRCPACKEVLRDGANFCVICGLEVRPLCPACREERFLLANLERGRSAWCARRNALLFACETCGRWLLPGTRRCPNPECGGRVLPTKPQHMGRRWDGRGSAVDWAYVERRPLPDGTLPEYAVQNWNAPETLHAAFVAHGLIFAWSGQNLLALGSEFGAEPVIWRTALGAATAVQRRIPFVERAAVAGAGVTLATDRGWLLAGLAGRSEPVLFQACEPLAQAANPNFWVGWGVENGVYTLRASMLAPAWDRLVSQQITVPEGGGLVQRGRIVMRDSRAYWHGQDGGIWQWDGGEANTVTRIVAPIEGIRDIWAASDGVRMVREAQGRLSVGLGAPLSGFFPVEAPAGLGPLRGISADAETVVVIGERPMVFRARTGERLHESTRPAGRWITSALVAASDNEPRLMILAQEAARGRLTALKLSSGYEELLYIENDIEPLALLPVGSLLLIAHSRGIVRLLA